MTELQEIRMKAQWLEEEIFEVADNVPELKELLGPEFFTQERPVLVGDYLLQVGERISKLRAALLNLKFWAEHPWPEAMLKLLSTAMPPS